VCDQILRSFICLIVIYGCVDNNRTPDFLPRVVTRALYIKKRRGKNKKASIYLHAFNQIYHRRYLRAGRQMTNQTTCGTIYMSSVSEEQAPHHPPRSVHGRSSFQRCMFMDGGVDFFQFLPRSELDHAGQPR
jgi:hypothetical protein